MAGLPILAIGASLDETLILTGEGGGAYRVEVRSDTQNDREFAMAGYPARGAVSITIDDHAALGRGSQTISGSLVNSVDSLVGREPELTDALEGSPEGVQSLGMLRTFMLIPVV
jgi:hypothetical protein